MHFTTYKAILVNEFKLGFCHRFWTILCNMCGQTRHPIFAVCLSKDVMNKDLIHRSEEVEMCVEILSQYLESNWTKRFKYDSRACLIF